MSDLVKTFLLGLSVWTVESAVNALTTAKDRRHTRVLLDENNELLARILEALTDNKG